MNITIKITSPNGAVMEVNIPMPDFSAQASSSAVVTPDAPQAASEQPILRDSGDVHVSVNESNSAGDKLVSLHDLISGRAIPCAYATTGEKMVGKDEEGIGRIGGTGERKETGGEGKGEEENRAQIFKCSDGTYVMPDGLYNDFCAAFGHPFVDAELIKARLWCETNERNRKTRRGMGRFINSWLCRAQGEKRMPIKARSGSLLESTNRNESW